MNEIDMPSGCLSTNKHAPDWIFLIWGQNRLFLAYKRTNFWSWKTTLLPKTGQNMYWHTSFHHLLSIIAIGDVSVQYRGTRLDFKDFGATSAIFGSFLTNFWPWRLPWTPKQVKLHTGISVSIIYYHKESSRKSQDLYSGLWLKIGGNLTFWAITGCPIRFKGCSWPKIDETQKKFFWCVLAWYRRD